MSRQLTHLRYPGKQHTPTLLLSDQSTYEPVGKTVSITFDTAERFCIGWHDIATGEDSPCPEGAITSGKFSMCIACQKRTGFNPAFYHAESISPQQEARNAQPHILYLAYMGIDYVKVGISWGERGISRLLDQGARAGLILDTLPTALIARQYEEQISRLNSLHETTLTKTKLELLNKPIVPETAIHQLLDTKVAIEKSIGVTFTGSDVLLLDTFYTDKGALPTGEITPLTTPKISGTIKALVGDILIAEYEDRIVALPIKQYIGYTITISDEILPLDLDPQQMMLF